MAKPTRPRTTRQGAKPAATQSTETAASSAPSSSTSAPTSAAPSAAANPLKSSTPETKAPENKAPETKAPESKAPGATPAAVSTTGVQTSTATAKDAAVPDATAATSPPSPAATAPDAKSRPDLSKQSNTAAATKPAATPPSDVAAARTASPTPTPTTTTATTAAARPAAAAPAPSRGVLPLVFGGAVVALLGFLAAWLGFSQPQTDPAITARLDALATEVAALPAPAEAADLAPLTEAQSALGTDLAGLATDTTSRLESLAASIAGLETRITAVERAPSEDGSVTQTAITSFERELGGLRDEITAQESRIQTMADEAAAALAAARAEAQSAEAEAEAVADAAMLRAAVARLRAAIDTGASLTEPLADLEAAGVAVPEALASQAETGVPTLVALQSDFPDISRAALASARAADDQSGMGSLFSNMLQVRSVEPRDGDDPDAVLSRAEAAVRENRLAEALVELQSLPEVAAEVVAPWRSRTTARLDALAAVDTLDTSMSQ